MALVALGGIRFVFSLDRYPLPYTDEPCYNCAAIHYVDTGTFRYLMSRNTPHGGQLWAISFPFYPRLQVLSFSLLGTSLFTTRLPQYLAAHLAVLILCVLLLRRNYYRSAIVFAFLWLGDRAAVEVLIGRMDGLVLLSLVLGYVCLVNTHETGKLWWNFGCGLCLATAVGFHPMAAYISLVVFAFHLLLIGRCTRISALWMAVLGACIPALLFAWLWTPGFKAHLEQFRWFLAQYHAGVAGEQSHQGLGQLLFERLKWSRWWVFFLVGTALFVLVPALIGQLVTRRNNLTSNTVLWLFAAIFAVAVLTVLILTKRFIYTYNFVQFTPWPTLALLILWETKQFNRFSRWIRLPLLAVGILCWLPSLFWNTMRFREVVLNYKALDQQLLVRKLQEVIPAETPVTGTPDFFIAAHQAKLQFTPSPWLETKIHAPSNSWILLTADEAKAHRIAPENLAVRQVIFAGNAFPSATTAGLRYPILIYGPITSQLTLASGR